MYNKHRCWWTIRIELGRPHQIRRYVAGPVRALIDNILAFDVGVILIDLLRKRIVRRKSPENCHGGNATHGPLACTVKKLALCDFSVRVIVIQIKQVLVEICG